MYFPGCFYKNRWECTMMGKIFSSLNSMSLFSSLKQRSHEERLQMQHVSSCSLFNTGSQLVAEPYNPSLWPGRLSEAHQKTKVSKGLLQGQNWKEATAGPWTLSLSAWEHTEEFSCVRLRWVETLVSLCLSISRIWVVLLITALP